MNFDEYETKSNEMWRNLETARQAILHAAKTTPPPNVDPTNTVRPMLDRQQKAIDELLAIDNEFWHA